MRLRIGIALVVLCVAAGVRAEDTEARDATREKLRAVLDRDGRRSDVNCEFRQSDKQPYNFVGTMDDELKNAESLEIVVRVTTSDTISFRVFPHYKDGYINLDKVKDSKGLMKRMLLYNDENFLFWGADESKDVFCAYTVTLESGFPDEALTVILRSIRAADRFVGELRPYIDGSVAKK
jgi:hypothetical protein